MTIKCNNIMISNQIFNYNECGVCLDKKYLCKTNCNCYHYFCLECIVRVNKCPFCRKDFILPKLFKDLKKYFLEKDNERLNEIKNLFDILPNYIEPIHNIEQNGNLQSTNLFIDYIYLDTEERRRFAEFPHEYLIDQLNFTTNYNYIPLVQTNLNLI